MECPSCTRDIPESSRFCVFCGTPIRRCDQCGRRFPPDAEFCGSCGANITAEIERPAHTPDLNGTDASPRMASEDHRWNAGERDGVYGFIYDPDFPEQRHYVAGGDITLGAGDKNDIVIDKPAVSWNHALFICRDGRIRLQDSASTNGTFVNEVEVRKPRDLQHGDLLRFGNVEFRLWIRPQLREGAHHDG